MTRNEIAANGITSVFCLTVRGSSPLEFLCPPNRFSDITSPEEDRAEVWVREIDAMEMKRRAEHLSGLKLELVRRPTLIGGADPYCPRCGHTGSHNPFCGTLWEEAAIPVIITNARGTTGRVEMGVKACAKCGASVNSTTHTLNGGVCEACRPFIIDPERVRQGDDELEISVTELAAGMATAAFREETGGRE